jgi:hypothetical protein
MELRGRAKAAKALARWVESLATLPVVAAPSSYATKGR